MPIDKHKQCIYYYNQQLCAAKRVPHDDSNIATRWQQTAVVRQLGGYGEGPGGGHSLAICGQDLIYMLATDVAGRGA